MNNNQIQSEIMDYFNQRLEVVPTEDGYRVVMPFHDSSGDPIEIAINHVPDGYVIEDLEQISGLLFFIEQGEMGKIGYELLQRICRTNNIEIDYNVGILQMRSQARELPSKFWDFISVISSLQNVLPHVAEPRVRHTLGPRLRTRVSKIVPILKEPEFVRRNSVAQGKQEFWNIDYRYHYEALTGLYDTMVVTVDLNIDQPRHKAEHAVALAVDVLDKEEPRRLRLLYDTYGRNSDALKAGEFIEAHKGKLGYEVYDFSQEIHRNRFKMTTEDELAHFLQANIDTR